MFKEYTYKKGDLVVLIALLFLIGYWVAALEQGYSEEVSEGAPVESSVVEAVSESSESVEKEEFYVDIDEIESKDALKEAEVVEEVVVEEKIEEIADSVEEKESAESSEGGSGGESVEKSYEYLDLDIVVNDSANEEVEEVAEESAGRDSNDGEVAYVFYKGSKKEIEANLERGSDVEIKKEESVEENDEEWVKRVKVYSSEHVENPLTVFADIVESEKDDIEVYWQEEGRYLEFEVVEQNDDGLISRISWIVPHLSEQNFEIIVNLNGEESNSSEILITPVSLPSNVSVPPVVFSFNVSYVNISAVVCNLNIKNSANVTKFDANLSGEGLSPQGIYLENGGYVWEFSCWDTNNSSIKNSTSGSFLVNANYTPTIDFSSSVSTATPGDSVGFNFNIGTSVNSSITYSVDFGDGSSLPNVTLFTKSISNQTSHVYGQAGLFTAVLKVFVNASGQQNYQKTLVINVSSPVSSGDNQPPEIDLISPADNQVILNDSIVFRYSASDNVGIANCTLGIYFYNNTLFGTQVFSDKKTSLANGEEVSINLTNFDEGDYDWDVECYDSSSNYERSFSSFEVSFSNVSSLVSLTDKFTIENLNSSYERKEEVEELLDAINDFIGNEAVLPKEAKEAVEDMNLIEDLKFYKKKLLQIETDLRYNIDFIKDESTREQRKKDIYDELDEMKRSVPSDFKVVESKEYYKNSVDFDIEDTVRAYVEFRNLALNERKIKELAKGNEELQRLVGVGAKAKSVEIDYLDGSEERFVLVTKEIDLKEQSFDSIMEVIPEGILKGDEEVNFINEHEVVREKNVFEVKLENLKDNKIIYSVKGGIQPAEIEETSTLVFNEDISGNELGLVTGFSILVGSGMSKGAWFYLSWISVIAVGALSFIFVMKKAKIRRWRRQEDVRVLFELVSETSKALKGRDLARAKEHYNRAREIYPRIPNECKGYVYKKIEGLRVEIDKKDAGSLIKEFLAAAGEGRKEDALLIYDKINSIYGRMPEKYKEKVYNKVIPVVRSFRGY